MELVMQKVNKAFKEKKVINNFSLHIHSGECVGLIGPNGAGKSTIMKMITGILQQDSGMIKLDNKEMTKMKKAVGYLPQYPTFYEWMRVKESLIFMGQLFEIPDKTLQQRIKELLHTVGLENNEEDRIVTLSGGMKQRLGIAQALLHKPTFVILDEPVSALDPVGRREIIQLIQQIKNNTTVLLSTHILSDAEEICDRFVILKDGELVADTNNEDIYIEELLNKQTYVKNIKKQHDRYLIEVTDIDKNKFDVMKIINEKRINYKKIEIYRENLEDIFLNLVVKK